jgi:hypothetical protein
MIKFSLIYLLLPNTNYNIHFQNVYNVRTNLYPILIDSNLYRFVINKATILIASGLLARFIRDDAEDKKSGCQ